eukprot:4358178-Alexandrium_andersonii.AAC.1
MRASTGWAAPPAYADQPPTGATGGCTPAPFDGVPGRVQARRTVRRRGPAPSLRRLPGAARARGLRPCRGGSRLRATP